jgi:hypothetical protein
MVRSKTGSFQMVRQKMPDAICRDDEVRVIREFHKTVAGVNRLEVGGCDGVQRWTETGSLNNAGRYRPRGRRLPVIHGLVCLPGKERYKPVVYRYWEVQFSHLVQ